MAGVLCECAVHIKKKNSTQPSVRLVAVRFSRQSQNRMIKPIAEILIGKGCRRNCSRVCVAQLVVPWRHSKHIILYTQWILDIWTESNNCCQYVYPHGCALHIRRVHGDPAGLWYCPLLGARHKSIRLQHVYTIYVYICLVYAPYLWVAQASVCACIKKPIRLGEKLNAPALRWHFEKKKWNENEMNARKEIARRVREGASPPQTLFDSPICISMYYYTMLYGTNDGGPRDRLFVVEKSRFSRVYSIHKHYNNYISTYV